MRRGMGIGVAGSWLVMGAILWVGSLALHPPPPPDLAEFMALVADTGTRWVVVHWVAAVALSIFVVTSLIVLTARSRLTRGGWGLSAWAVLPVASLWVMTTAVAEATVISRAADAGNMAMFEGWALFAEGKAMGFMALALAVAAIAASEARSPGAATPAWAAWIGVAAGLAGFMGWLLGPVLRIAIGGPIFVLSSVVLGLWLLWLGVGLIRSVPTPAEPAASRHEPDPVPAL